MKYWLLFLAGCTAAKQDATVFEDAGFADATEIDASEPVDLGVVDAGPPGLGPVPPYPQREGDPEAGYLALLDNGYVGCGIPWTAYRQAFGATAPEALRLPNRNQLNAALPYNQTAFTTSSSVTVVTANCLTCHASVFEGQVVIGLGNANGDFTQDQSQAAELAGLLLSDPDERREWRKWADRIVAASPYIRTRTVGANPADNLAAILFAHRDPVTLAWSPTPLIEPPPREPLPVDVPPWWRMKKKNAMFYVAAGRGDHARIMMTASVLCVDSVAEARQIDAYFPDVRAYIASLEAPAFPDPVDTNLVAEGATLFEAHCSRCHGTPSDYPNLVVDVAEVGTDAALALGSSGQYAAQFRDWFARSFYGELSELQVPAGYIAPPLDGVWLTAPYLHNGSVPDLWTLLSSSERPRAWQKTNTYDRQRLGWRWQAARTHAEESDANRRRQIYDTTHLGYGNGGHTFGDFMTEAQRWAVIEYLKTL